MINAVVGLGLLFVFLGIIWLWEWAREHWWY